MPISFGYTHGCSAQHISEKAFCDCEPQFDDDLVNLVSQVGKASAFAFALGRIALPETG
jgi:hypothetical protein